MHENRIVSVLWFREEGHMYTLQLHTGDSILCYTYFCDHSSICQERMMMPDRTPILREESSQRQLISSSAATVHMIKANWGFGIMALPLCFHYSGLAVGVLGKQVSKTWGLRHVN